MDLTSIELKFLLQLLGRPHYRASIKKIRPNPKTSAAKRDRICLQLCSKGLVDYTYEAQQFAITPAGFTLLNLDTTSLPVTPAELWTLRSCLDRSITPREIHRKVPVNERQQMIRSLEQRGLVKVTKTQLKEVWLTQLGQHYLRHDVCPKGASPVLSLNLLGDYLYFLRQSLSDSTDPDSTALSGEEALADAFPTQPLSPEDVLEIIRRLDKTLGGENYLPIFKLREKLQPPFSRDQLDQVLYQLQRNDQIELSSLQDVTAYSESQLASGIAQDIGGSLFFIRLN